MEPFELPTSWEPTNPKKPKAAHCPYCFGLVDSLAAKCKHCGEWLKADAKKAAVGADYFGAILSLLVCGLGQLKQGRLLAALLFFLFGYGLLLLMPLGTFSPTLVAGLAVYAWSILDAGYYPQRKWLRERGR